jgi:hypothetical protein
MYRQGHASLRRLEHSQTVAPGGVDQEHPRPEHPGARKTADEVGKDVVGNCDEDGLCV